MEPINNTTHNSLNNLHENLTPIGHVLKRKEYKTSKKWMFLVIPAITFTVVIVSIYFTYNSQLKTDNNIVNTLEQTLPSPTQISFKATIQYLSGQAWKIVDGRKVEIRENDILKENDTVSTDSDSRLVLALDEGSVIRLDEKTTITLTALKPEKISINEDKGLTFYRVNPGNNHLFTVIAGSYEAQSLGTVYSVENKDEVKVLVFENSVKVTKGEEEQQILKKNQQWTAVKNTVNTIDLKKADLSDFYQWSLQEEKIISITPTPTSKPTIISGISLSGKTSDKGIFLNWKTEGLNTSYGFKILKNISGNPKYPDDAVVFVSADSLSYLLDIADGQTWHIKVCQYLDNKCGVYSNEISVTAPSTSTNITKVSAIILKIEKITDTTAKASWTVNGNSELGFKVVWSKNSNPTYPTRESDSFLYFSDSETRSAEITELQKGSTYHFRVCEYLGGTCGIYSSDIAISF
jgi:hypothetical protein